MAHPSLFPLGTTGYHSLDDRSAPPSPLSSQHHFPLPAHGSARSPSSPSFPPDSFFASDPLRLSPTTTRTPREYAEGVARGEIGNDFGPYSPRSSPRASPDLRGRQSSPFYDDGTSSRSSSPGRVTAFAAHHEAPRSPTLGASEIKASSGPRKYAPVLGGAGVAYTAKEQALDDLLHTYSPADRLAGGGSFRAFSLRGWLNFVAVVAIAGGLIAVFAGYPIADWVMKHSAHGYNAFSLGDAVSNGTGQVPVIPNLPGLIDADTPDEFMTRVGHDGHTYQLVFSDEFNVDGRTFWPGDDPFWEAVDLHYWPTGDLEWYDPDAATTKNGSLVFTMTEEKINGLNYRSGMIQSWNKFCFTGGYIEVSISLPGVGDISGFWPGAWTIGNLARAGYGATTDGTWPYSYDSCDIGTLPNQTYVDGSGPPAALNTSVTNMALSYQPGQRLSACTCPADKAEHPGPSVKTGRGAPEIDIIEAQTFWTGQKLIGAVSQSAQFAPYDADYVIRNSTPYVTVYDSDRTVLNEYTGAVYQQAASAITATDVDAYQDAEGTFSAYGFEYWPSTGSDGYITWYSGGEPSWTLTSDAVGPNAESGVGQRTISPEPLSIVLNLGISDGFQTINFDELEFPGVMKIDHVRVYQREGSVNLGCDPKAYPTADYIANHLNAYSNPNLTTWAEAGYEYPRNSLKDTC
ncbi:hypothetical protein JCM8208_002530 [Rhodotorula glutinis]